MNKKKLLIEDYVHFKTGHDTYTSSDHPHHHHHHSQPPQSSCQETKTAAKWLRWGLMIFSGNLLTEKSPPNHLNICNQRSVNFESLGIRLSCGVNNRRGTFFQKKKSEGEDYQRRTEWTDYPPFSNPYGYKSLNHHHRDQHTWQANKRKINQHTYQLIIIIIIIVRMKERNGILTPRHFATRLTKNKSISWTLMLLLIQVFLRAGFRMRFMLSTTVGSCRWCWIIIMSKGFRGENVEVMVLMDGVDEDFRKDDPFS